MDKDHQILQNSFHNVLTTYINDCAVSRPDKLISLISTTLSSQIKASTIVNQYKSLNMTADVTDSDRYTIEPYTGRNRYVTTMIDGLTDCKNDLIGAYIHGSLATEEDNNYSDFDALVIISDAVFDSPSRIARLAVKLNALRKIMLRYDPLQHHGWFVLAEADLRCYCDAYFPVSLFQYTRSLYTDKGLSLDIQLRDSSIETMELFSIVINSITTRLANGSRPGSIYQLKCLLSEFMLLPALYLQVINGKGVYKKHSFEIAKQHFSPDEWSAMDQASYIRENWNYNIDTTRKYLLTNFVTPRRVITKRLAPAIPEEILTMLDDSFYNNIINLCLKMKQKIKH